MRCENNHLTVMLFLARLVLWMCVFIAKVVCDCHEPKHHCWSSEYHIRQEAATQQCFEKLCHCSNTTANCSLTYGDLTFVPALQIDYQVLNFSYNNLTNISSTFFHNASSDVRLIDLYNNGLAYIASGAFRHLKKLTTLLLGGSNLVGYKDMPELLNLPSLLNISFSCVGLRPIPHDVFRDMKKSKLIYFDLSWNYIGSLNLSLFQPLRHLKVIELWHNEIYGLETAHLPSWEEVSFSTNRLYQFPQTCFSSKSSRSLFPNLQKLYLDYNMISCIADPVCLPKLQYLSINFNRFEYLVTDTFSRARFPKLKILNIIEMENKILKMQHHFINNSQVREINFILNYIDFSSKDVVDIHAFGGCTGVDTLTLSKNSFQGVSDERFHHLLHPMRHSLRVLNLGHTSIQRVSTKTFSKLNLTKLDLYENSVSFIPDGTFDSLVFLKTLTLDENQISVISQTTFGPHLQNNLEYLNLSRNPFYCSCDILWFQRWMKNNPGVFRHVDIARYQCHNHNNLSVTEFVLNDQACILGSDAAAFTISVACLLITFFLLFTIVFRFRWHMRLWLYEICRGRRRRRARGGRRYKYDVFVSYAEENTAWVTRELLPLLEGEWGLRLCVHHRDFVPGKHIVDNICDCVSDSDRVLLVFSPFFAQSEWCQFELKYCQACVMDRDDVLMLVVMQETESRHMTSAMLAVMRTTTYLEWADLPDARASFWGRLRLALEETGDMDEVEA